MKIANADVAALHHKSTIPLKHRSNCPTARQLYDHIMRTEDFSPIVRTMVADNVCKTSAQAEELIAAFVQWFCAGATNLSKNHVMMVGPVDRTFHAMVLNTKWYFDFCYRHTGVYTHHDPLNAADYELIASMNAIAGTLERLESAFGAELHAELKKWWRMYKKGTLTPMMVSCTGNDGPFDIVPHT